MSHHVFIIDDDIKFHKAVGAILQRHDYCVTSVTEAESAVDRLTADPPDIILLDVKMPVIDGFETCRRIRTRPGLGSIPVVFVTGADDRESIGRCFESGAVDYIRKPFREPELLVRIELQLKIRHQHEMAKAAESFFPEEHTERLDAELKHPEAFARILTRDPTVIDVFRYIEAIANSSRPVLVRGETGVGKEAVAGLIHTISERTGAFITVNIAGLDDTLFSDTLFGHEKGAFTGADKPRRGLIDVAAGGTIFLDEIGDLRPESQVKLLRLIQQNEYYPLGSDTSRTSDARIVVATNRNLSTMLREGTFREDLFFRLKTHQVYLPPLRRRRGDIPLLLDHFIRIASRELTCACPAYPDYLIQFLSRYSFPGNIRELESMVFDAVSRSAGNELTIDIFRELILDDDFRNCAFSHIESDQDLPVAPNVMRGLTLREITDLTIQRTLDEADGNYSKAAKILGISRQALYKRMNRMQSS